MAIQRIVLEVTEPGSELFNLTVDGNPAGDHVTAEPTQGPDGSTAHRVILAGEVEGHRAYARSDARLKTDIRPL
jgi:hypothetical protein